MKYEFKIKNLDPIEREFENHNQAVKFGKELCDQHRKKVVVQTSSIDHDTWIEQPE